MWNTRTEARLHPEDTKTPRQRVVFRFASLLPGGPMRCMSVMRFPGKGLLIFHFLERYAGILEQHRAVFHALRAPKQASGPFPGPLPQQVSPLPAAGHAACPRSSHAREGPSVLSFFAPYLTRFIPCPERTKLLRTRKKKDAPQQQDVLLYASSSRQEKSFGSLSAYLDAASRLLWASTNAL